MGAHEHSHLRYPLALALLRRRRPMIVMGWRGEHLTATSASTGRRTRESAAKVVTFYTQQRDKSGLPRATNASVQTTGEIAWFVASWASLFVGNAASICALGRATNRSTHAPTSNTSAVRRLVLLCEQESINIIHASRSTECAHRDANRLDAAQMPAGGAAARGPVS